MIEMQCKYCASESLTKKGFVAGNQLYKCKECGKRFYLNGKLPKMRLDKSGMVAALGFYFDGMSLRQAQRNLETVLGLCVSQVTILNWVRKYSRLVSEYAQTLTPELSGFWHEDETMIHLEGRDQWFWEMIDEESRFLVASHLSGTRTMKDTITIFRKGLNMSKVRPRAVFVDGSHVYKPAFNKVFYSRYNARKVALVQRVGIQSRETNNLVERLHGTLKDRLKPMRGGLKDFDSAKDVLQGYTVHYNFVKPHTALKGKTPAQYAGIQLQPNWRTLIDHATAHSVGRPLKAKPQPVPVAPLVKA